MSDKKIETHTATVPQRIAGAAKAAGSKILSLHPDYNPNQNNQGGRGADKNAAGKGARLGGVVPASTSRPVDASFGDIGTNYGSQGPVQPGSTEALTDLTTIRMPEGVQDAMYVPGRGAEAVGELSPGTQTKQGAFLGDFGDNSVGMEGKIDDSVRISPVRGGRPYGDNMYTRRIAGVRQTTADRPGISFMTPGQYKYLEQLKSEGYGSGGKTYDQSLRDLNEEYRQTIKEALGDRRSFSGRREARLINAIAGQFAPRFDALESKYASDIGLQKQRLGEQTEAAKLQQDLMKDAYERFTDERDFQFNVGKEAFDRDIREADTRSKIQNRIASQNQAAINSQLQAGRLETSRAKEMHDIWGQVGAGTLDPNQARYMGSRTFGEQWMASDLEFQTWLIVNKSKYKGQDMRVIYDAFIEQNK